MSEKIILEINIVDINWKNNIKIFWFKLVKINKYICKKIIAYKEYYITESYNFKYNNNKLKIKLIGIINITDMSYIFYGFSSSSLPDIPKLNKKYINFYHKLVSGLENLKIRQ